MVSDDSLATERGQQNYEKGNKNERHAARILNRVYRASRVGMPGNNNDVFRFVDVQGIRHGLPMKLVQVKTNQFPPKTRKKYARRAGRYVDGKHAVFEVWVREDYVGWHIHRYTGADSTDGGPWFEHLYDLPCDPHDAGTEYQEREHPDV